MERKNFIKQINDVMKSVINIQHSIKNLGGGGPSNKASAMMR